jgi:hypothetical protein
VLLLTLHHIAADGWSMGILVREAAALYAAWMRGEGSPLAEPPVQYADFARWQREQLEGEALERQLGYWRRRLAGELPRLDFARLGGAAGGGAPGGAAAGGGAAAVSFALGAELSAALGELGRREGATLFMVLAAGAAALLARWGGVDEVVLGTDVANRTRGETEGLIGFFVNQLVLRVDAGGDPGFRELLGRVRRVTLEAYAHQDLPFERLVEALAPRRRRERNPLFQVKLVHQNLPLAAADAPAGVELAPFDAAPPPARFDLALFTSAPGGRVEGSWVYARELFAAERIEGLAAAYAELLEAVVRDPETRLADLAAGEFGRPPADAPAERRQRARERFLGTRPQRLRAPDDRDDAGGVAG